MLPASLWTALALSTVPTTRVAVMVDDGAVDQPTRAALEAALQQRGFEVVSAEVSEKLRKSVAPKSLLESRLPDGLSVLEADAILAGSVGYGPPTDVDGVQSVQVNLTARLIDLGTGRTTSTLQVSGVGLGVPGPSLQARGAKQAVDALFKGASFAEALKGLGQAAGMVTLVVQGVPTREALLELKNGLERALAGVPVKEIYFAKGLGKLMLGGSEAKSMVGPEIADAIGETKSLALVVEEVANTRIVAGYNKARAVQVHALVLEPRVPKGTKISASELGRYMATRFATFEFARATYQPGKLSREQALAEAKKHGATVLVESELLGSGPSTALAVRIVEVKTGRPIYREQQAVSQSDSFAAAETMLAMIKTQLPERIGVNAGDATGLPTETSGPAVASGKRDR